MPVSDFTRLAGWFLKPRKPKPKVLNYSDIVIGFTEKGEPVLWPNPSKEANKHSLFAASSGIGKTITVSEIISTKYIISYEFFPPEECPCYFILDPKSDLGKGIIQSIAVKKPKLLSNIIYLNPFQKVGTNYIPFPFNLNRLGFEEEKSIIAMVIAILIDSLSTGIGSQAHLGTGSRQFDVLYHTIWAAMEASHPQASVLWAYDALQDPRYGLKKLAKMTTNKRVKAFLEKARLSDELRASSSSRMRLAFFLIEQLEKIFSADSSIQFAELFKPGKLVIVDLGSPPSGLTMLSQFFSNLIVRIATDYLLTRESPWQGHACEIYCDESQLLVPVLDDLVENILCTGRSRGIAISLITQTLSALNDGANKNLLSTLMANIPFKTIGRLSAEDSECFAKQIAPKAGVDETLSETRSKFIASTTNLHSRQFLLLEPGKRTKFTSVEVDMDARNEAEEKYSDVIEKMKTELNQKVEKQRLTLDEAVYLPKRKTRSNSSYNKNSTSTNTNSKNNKPNKQNPRSPWG